jgi:predicted NACHT family NTPase
MLLFDGLDEVNTQERQRVVNKINDLLDKYPHCHAVITCRVAVYHNEFAEKTEQTLEMVDFNEQQIRAFLVPWQKDMPASKSIKQLLHTLHERPRILQLAGNPLLLTIIAYLYTDTTFVLPHSRAEFYTEATKALLEWKREHNRYKTANKQAVLRHLALFNQDSSGESKQDRRSIDLKTVLAQVKQVLPTLNLTNDDIEPLLDEIVERSGLLLMIDGGERYQFAHLTLQEFFAALALRDDANQLLTRFKVDQDAWRETIKIWCGLDHDSSKFIRKIYDIDPIIAFECLADAQEVNSVLANQIVGKFKHHLGREDRIGEGINQAFAAIAADTRRRRGQEIFDFLANTLANTKENEQRRVAAAKILSMTNLPKAAEVLVHYKKIPGIRTALIRMGDLAVPVLEKLAKTRKSIYRV